MVIYVLIVLASAMQSASAKEFNKNCSHSSVFNAIKSCSALIAAFGFQFHLPTLLFGCLYGACLCVSMFAGYQALSRGPMALTSMLGSFSVIFSFFALRKVLLKEWKGLKGKRYGVLSGLANGTANFLTLVLAGLENASVLFPMISAGTILASLLCGRLIFKEKLKANHYFALAAGIAATILLKL